MTAETTVAQRQTIGETPAKWSQAVTFAPFDPVLGTLVDVQVGITAKATGSVSLENLGVTSGTDSVALRRTVPVFDPGGRLTIAGAVAATNAIAQGRDRHLSPRAGSARDISRRRRQ